MDLVLAHQSPRPATEVGISAEPHGGSVGEVEININLKPYLSPPPHHLPPPPATPSIGRSPVCQGQHAAAGKAEPSRRFELLRWGQMQMAVLVDLFLVISTLTITQQLTRM